MKQCKTCKLVKPLGLFYRDPRISDGYRGICIACDNLRRVTHRAANPKKKARDGLPTFDRQAYDKKWREANRDKLRARAARHAKENAPAYAARAIARHAAKLQATPAWANLDRIREFYEFAAMVSACTGTAWHVDHIVPLQS